MLAVVLVYKNLYIYINKYICMYIYFYKVQQRSPTFLAPGIGFMEDNFSTDWGGGGMVQVVMQAMGSEGEQQMKLCSLTGRGTGKVGDP